MGGIRQCPLDVFACCSVAADACSADDVITFERLDMRGIKLRRLVGDIWTYKRMVTSIMALVNQSASAKLKVL